MSKKSGLGKFLLGAGIGLGLGILFAPKSGKETRADLKKKMDNLIEKAKNIDVEEVKATIEAKVTEIKEDLKNLDKETVAAKIRKIAYANHYISIFDRLFFFSFSKERF